MLRDSAWQRRSIEARRQSSDGGQGGIRTHGEREPTAVFKTAALNHSATCPSVRQLAAARANVTS